MMRVRPMLPADVGAWLGLEGVSGPDAEAWLAAERATDPEPWSWLFAVRDGRVVGRARAVRAGTVRRVADLLVAPDTDPEPVAAAVLDACEQRFGDVEVASWAPGDGLDAVAVRRGYTPWVERV